MRKVISSFATIMCVLFLQASIALAGGSSSTGDGSLNPEGAIPQPITKLNSSKPNQFDIFMKLHNDSKTSFSSKIQDYIASNWWLFSTTNLIAYSSDGTSSGRKFSRFTFEVTNDGRGVELSDELIEKDYRVNLLGIAEFLQDEWMTFTLQKNEDYTEMNDGRQIKLRITKYKSNQYITGVITTDRNGKCFKSLLYDSTFQLTPKVEYQPKNGVCAVFVAWK